MNSIDQQQREDNYEDLQRGAAVEKIKEIVKDAPTCFFTTAEPVKGSIGVRPMNVRKVDDDGNLWFLSADDSHKNLELAENPKVRLYFQGSTHSDFMCLIGHATISTDRALIEELWAPLAKTWFTEGKDDPRITVIKVAPNDGYYWDTKHGTPVAGLKMLIGAALGKTMDDSIQGQVRP